MKRIIIALLILTSLSAVSQESVLLRVNYKKGDKYVVKVEQKTNSGLQGGMNMNMTMSMLIKESDGKTFKTESKIMSILMDMIQGGQTMSFDSSKKTEDLDQMGQMLKIQFDPMMKATIINTISNLGESIDVKVEPSIPGMDQLLDQSSSISYPKEKVSVGSSWNSEDKNQGIKMKTIYKVLKISNGTVYLDIIGTVTGSSKGTIKGEAEIDVETGIQKKSELEVSVSGSGVEIVAISKISMTKA